MQFRVTNKDKRTPVQSLNVVGPQRSLTLEERREVALTQTMQVAYNTKCRKSAELLTLLAEDLLRRTRCLNVTSAVDQEHQNYRVVPLTNQAALIQILLSVRGESQQSLTSWGSKYLLKHGKQDSPSYRFEMFNQESFENVNFKNTAKSIGSVQIGDSLKFGLDKTESTQVLFGAMLRMPSLSSGFNIKLGLPALPEYKEDLPMEPPTYLAPPLKAQSIDSPRKRLQKQQRKEEVSVWSLATLVQAPLLPIQKLWEDESLHPTELKVTEIGLLTFSKEEAFSKAYHDLHQPLVNAQCSSQHLSACIINLLQGIPTEKVFELQTSLVFKMSPGLQIVSDSEFPCHSSESLLASVSEFLEAGCLFMHLREFQEYMSQQHISAGLTVQAFASAIREFLVFYQHQVTDLQQKAFVRRQDEARMSGFSAGFQSVSLLEIKVMMAPLIQQLKALADICLLQTFIDQLSEMRQPDMQFQSLLYKRETFAKTELQLSEQSLLNLKQKHWLQFPRGAQLLTYIYKVLLTCEADQQLEPLLRTVFQRTLQPMLKMVQDFVNTGRFDDPFGEFWVSGTIMDANKAPSFFRSNAELIFKTGLAVGQLCMFSSVYFKICENTTDLSIVQDMRSAKQSKEAALRTFTFKFRQLLDLEKGIQDKEFQSVYEMVAMRERASQFRMTQFEIERDAIRQEKFAKQQQRLRTVMDELADREAFNARLEKERQLLLQQEEQERKRLQQLEQRMIQEMRKRLLSIIDGKARVADIREADVKEEERIELQLEEALAQQVQPEQVNVQMEEAIDLGQVNVEMVDDSDVARAILEEILQRVWDYEAEKQAIINKRKTWAIKRQEDSLSQARRKRQEWKPAETHIARRLKLLLGETQSRLDVPVTLAIEQVCDMVALQSKLANKCLLHYSHRSIEIIEHLAAIKSIMLGGSGDTIASWLEAVFNNDWLQTAKDSSVGCLNTCLEMAVRPGSKFVHALRFKSTQKGMAVETNFNFFFNLMNVSPCLPNTGL